MGKTLFNEKEVSRLSKLNRLCEIGLKNVFL